MSFGAVLCRSVVRCVGGVGVIGVVGVGCALFKGQGHVEAEEVM